MPRPSASAAPMNARPNWPSAADGLRSAPERKLPKIVPTPMAAAPMPMAARPAPTYLAATGSIIRAPSGVLWATVCCCGERLY